MNTYIIFFDNFIKLIELNFFYSLLLFTFFIFIYSSLSLPVGINDIFSPCPFVATNFFSARFVLLDTTDHAPSRIL